MSTSEPTWTGPSRKERLRPTAENAALIAEQEQLVTDEGSETLTRFPYALTPGR